VLFNEIADGFINAFSPLVFVPMITKVVTENKISHVAYETLLLKLRGQTTSLYLELIPPKESEEATIPVHLEVLNVILINHTNANSLKPKQTTAMPKLKVNEFNFQKVWTASQQFSKDDWVEWLRKFAIGQLSESPSPALRACQSLAQIYQPLLQVS